MNALEVSQSGLAILLVASFTSGLAAAALHRLGCVILAVVAYRPRDGYPHANRVAEMIATQKSVNEKNEKKRPAGVLINDISLPIVSALLLLSVNFILNNGQMRIMSVLALSAAMWLWQRILHYPISYVLVYALLLIRFAIYYLTLPLKTASRYLSNVAIKTALRFKVKAQRREMKRCISAQKRTILQLTARGMLDSV